MKPRIHFFIIISIVFLALFFRLNNVNWDEGYHLHPDERFLTMVANAMQIPPSLDSYLDPDLSTLNPRNIGHAFFVYGVFPLSFTKAIAVAWDSVIYPFYGLRADGTQIDPRIVPMDSYNGFTLLGRTVSGLIDAFVLVFVYKIVELLEQITKRKGPRIFSPNTKYWVMFLYAIAVLPIQLSHFFATDTFMNTFLIGSFYFSLQYAYSKKWWPLVASAIFFGLAVASKVNAVFMIPLLGVMLLLGAGTVKNNESEITIRTFSKSSIMPTVKVLLFAGLVFTFISYITLRLANPYYFQSANVFNPTISTQFIENIQSLKHTESREGFFPPAIQWMNKPAVTFSLVNMAVFGLGIPFFTLMVLGVGRVIIASLWKDSSPSKREDKKSVQSKSDDHVNNESNISIMSKLFRPGSIILLASLGWVLAFFLYQSSQFVKALRYFIFLYPFLAIFGGIGVTWLFKIFSTHTTSIQKRFGEKNLATGGLVLFITILLIWPLMFSSIYFNRNTRVVASEWIYENLPNGSFLVGEHWDDPLPLLLPNQTKQFTGELLPVFHPDDENKWREMNEILAKGDYLIQSSNRGWGSIPTVPEKYPRMVPFYEDLLADRLEYKKIQEFTSYPSLRYLGIPLELPDDWADETFTVYDHPKVIIYEKR